MNLSADNQELILDCVPFGVFILNDERKITFWNKWLTSHTKITFQEARSKSLLDLFPNSNNQRFAWAIEQVFTTHSPQILSQVFNRYLIPIKINSRGPHSVPLMQQQIQIIPYRSNEQDFAVVTINDVTENVIRSSVLTELAQKLEQDSNHDQLTGLYNRRFMWEWLLNQMNLAKRQNYYMACLLMDIDHFKMLNDQKGHDEGDRVLVSFASLVSECIRESDIVVRYGGEEFIVLLPHCKPDESIQCAERIRNMIASNALGQQDIGKVTCSIGISLFSPNDPITGEALLKNADKRLYEAKNAGRNQVIPRNADSFNRIEKN